MSSAGPGSLFYRVFKYTMYSLLAINIVFWFREDLAASAQTFADGVSWRNAVEAFSSTVDTVAWVVLLLLFELETAVIPDEKLRGSLKWVLSAIRAVCYTFITYALWGYLAKYGLITDLLPLAASDPCALIGGGYSYINSLDDYLPLTAHNCAALAGQPLYQVAGTQIVGSASQVELARNLALTDVINASTWLIVVVTLEIEVWLQLKQLLSARLLRANKALKAGLYTILFGCAVYWGIDGQFLDFWDAFLWLVAFLFIELNIFRWQAGTEPAATALS